MFAFSQIEPNRTGEISRYDIPINRWLDLKFESGRDFTAGGAISRMTEDAIADGPEVSAELANKEWGIPGYLKFDGPIKAQVAALRNARKLRELELTAHLNAADHSWASWKGVAGFGAQMVGNISHPLDFGLMFLPVVGSSMKAKAAADAGRGIVRQAIARGVFTEEALAARIAFPRFGAAVIDGTIGNALAEIPVFVQKTRDQADYGVSDAAINIAGGGVFAGALHLGFRGLARAFDRLSPEIKEHMLQHEADAFLKSETPVTSKIAQVDENAIALRVEEDLRAEGLVSVESEMAIEAAIRARQAGATERPFDVIDAIEGHVGGKLELANARSFREVFEPTGAARELFAAEGRKLDDVLAALHSEGLFKRIETDEQLLDAILGAAEGRKAFREQVSGQGNGSRQIREARTANERERRIREYIDSRKPERIAAAKAAELQAQQAQGKILSDEQIKEFTLASDEQAATAIKADAANIEAHLKSELQSKLQDEALTPEQKEALQAELDEALAEVDEGLVDQTKAIEQAKNCLLQNG